MAKTILRLTNKSALVKVSDAQTIALATDLLLATEELDVVHVPSVSISRVFCTGGATIVRNGVTIVANLPSVGSMDLDLSQFEGKDVEGATSNIVITPQAGYQVYVLLRKDAGYITKIQPEIFGSYDNPTSTSA